MHKGLERKSIPEIEGACEGGSGSGDGGEAPVTGWNLTGKHIHAKLGNFDLILSRQSDINEKKKTNKHKKKSN